jgi:hypothetical protein
MALITCTTARFTCPEPMEVKGNADESHHANPASRQDPHSFPQPYLCCTPTYTCAAHPPVPVPEPAPVPAFYSIPWLYRGFLSSLPAAFWPACGCTGPWGKASFSPVLYNSLPSSQTLRSQLVLLVSFLYPLPSNLTPSPCKQLC